jgi:hypothetical protein
MSCRREQDERRFHALRKDGQDRRRRKTQRTLHYWDVRVRYREAQKVDRLRLDVLAGGEEADQRLVRTAIRDHSSPCFFPMMPGAGRRKEVHLGRSDLKSGSTSHQNGLVDRLAAVWTARLTERRD